MQRGVLFGRRDFLKQRSAVAVLQALIGGQAPPAFFGFAGPAFEVGGLDRARPSGERLLELRHRSRGMSVGPLITIDGKAIPVASPRALS